MLYAAGINLLLKGLIKCSVITLSNDDLIIISDSFIIDVKQLKSIFFFVNIYNESRKFTS